MLKPATLAISAHYEPRHASALPDLLPPLAASDALVSNCRSPAALLAPTPFVSFFRPSGPRQDLPIPIRSCPDRPKPRNPFRYRCLPATTCHGCGIADESLS